MAILLPVVNYTVDEIVLDYLRTQYGDQSSNYNSDLNENKKNSTDENNNNNQVDFDDIGEQVGDWANEPWEPCDDVEIPVWAKLEGPKVEDGKKVDEDLVWADDPWTQTPLVNIPAWMRLPGIDYDIPEDSLTVTDRHLENNGGNHNDAQDNDADFLASNVEVRNWSEEIYLQLPLDVPRWALLPGIDYPSRWRNSLYWGLEIKRNLRIKDTFRRQVYERKLPILLEEKKAYNDDAKEMLYVPTRYGRFCCPIDN